MKHSGGAQTTTRFTSSGEMISLKSPEVRYAEFRSRFSCVLNLAACNADNPGRLDQAGTPGACVVAMRSLSRSILFRRSFNGPSLSWDKSEHLRKERKFIFEELV